MKRWMTAIMVCLLIVAQAALAEIPDVSAMSDAELAQLAQNVQAEQQKRAQGAGSEAPEPVEITLKKGDKSEDVRALQTRLIELNYLSGGADGAFGGKTEAAVKMFQKACALEASGVADPETLNALYAADAPVAKVYNQLNFKEISRDPESYKGQYYSFSGKVLQVLEGYSYGGTTSMEMRIATRGGYDDVVYVTYERPDGDKRILEDDRVTVYAECNGLYTYETVIGGSVTLPMFEAEAVSFN